VEEGSFPGTLAFDCEHGYTDEEFAAKRERIIDLVVMAVEVDVRN